MKHRSEDERRTLVEAWEKSGVSVAAFCRTHGVAAESLRRWRRGMSRAATHDAPAMAVEVGNGCFLPVSLVKRPKQGGAASCFVEISGSIRIACDSDTSEDVLAKAIRAAVAACGPILAR